MSSPLSHLNAVMLYFDMGFFLFLNGWHRLFIFAFPFNHTITLANSKQSHERSCWSACSLGLKTEIIPSHRLFAVYFQLLILEVTNGRGKVGRMEVSSNKLQLSRNRNFRLVFISMLFSAPGYYVYFMGAITSSCYCLVSLNNIFLAMS